MASYIERAIKSAQQQEIEADIEILICDDHSTDNTSEILDKFKTISNITILYNNTNQGVLKSLSRLISIAKGKYVALLDADDYWCSTNHLKIHHDIYKSQNEIGFIFGNYQFLEEGSGRTNTGMKENFLFPAKNQFEFSLLNYPILTSTSSFRKELITEKELNDYILNNFPTSDYGIYLGLMLKSTGFYSSEITTVYNFRINSQSRKADIYARISHMINRHKIGDYFIDRHHVDKKIVQKRDFLLNQKVLLASWLSFNHSFIKKNAAKLKLTQFLKYNPKASYIYFASKSKFLYKICRPWVLRKRPPGQ